MTASFKTSAESATTLTEIVCPNDTNPMGMLLGGRLVQWMDVAAAICAQLHAEEVCVTSFIDTMTFKASARVGEIVTVRAKLVRAFNTSMEIYVEAWSRPVKSSQSQMVSEAFFSFVAIDDKGVPCKVPGMKPQTPEEKKAFAAAGKRKRTKLKSR
jgi:acyl-CoA hydrolase